jgi:hypothetical protein
MWFMMKQDEKNYRMSFLLFSSGAAVFMSPLVIHLSCFPFPHTLQSLNNIHVYKSCWLLLFSLCRFSTKYKPSSQTFCAVCRILSFTSCSKQNVTTKHRASKWRTSTVGAIKVLYLQIMAVQHMIALSKLLSPFSQVWYSWSCTAVFCKEHVTVCQHKCTSTMLLSLMKTLTSQPTTTGPDSTETYLF